MKWLSRVQPRALFFSLLLTFTFSLFTSISAQPESAPPPLIMISKGELSQLDAERDEKDRTKLILNLMNSRVVAAERSNGAKDFTGVFRELGVFHALIDNSLDYLARRDIGKNRTLDNFKRVEIGLRGFASRIETIRREIPLEYDDYLRTLLKHIREARTRASEPLFSNSVVTGR